MFGADPDAALASLEERRGGLAEFQTPILRLAVSPHAPYTCSLDLYRASAGGCSNSELGRVTAWDFRDGEVYLFQPGGAVAARLRPSGSGLTGVLAKSGAPLSLTRG